MALPHHQQFSTDVQYTLLTQFTNKVTCMVCGITFESIDSYNQHIFKVDGDRWCGIKILRMLEAHEGLAPEISRIRRIWKQ